MLNPLIYLEAEIMTVEVEGLIDMSQPGKEEDSEDSAEIEMTEVTKTFLL